MSGRDVPFSATPRVVSEKEVLMRIRYVLVLVSAVFLMFGSVPQSYAFLEDLCQPRRNAQGVLTWCVRPDCPKPNPNRACPAQTADFATIMPGRSMVHHDATYFIAQALG